MHPFIAYNQQKGQNDHENLCLDFHLLTSITKALSSEQLKRKDANLSFVLAA